MQLLRTALAPLLTLALAAGPAVASQERGPAPFPAPAEGQPARPADVELEPYRAELLREAFEIARRYPAKPHQKNQARTLERIVEAALELDQPELALAMIPTNPNWRRGAGYAAYALYCVRHGHPEVARTFMARAQEVVDSPPMIDGQTWRRDRVRSAIAQCHVLLGELDRAQEIERTLEPSERGRSQVVAATVVGDEDFEAQVALVRGTLDSGNFDQMKLVLFGLPEVLAGVYADAERRDALVEAVEGSINWPKLPVTLRIEVLLSLAETAGEHGDGARALAFADRARALYDERAPWTAEPGVPLLAGLAAARAAGGDAEGAARLAGEALALYEQGRETLTDVFRAETLRPLAEAYWTMGERGRALALFRRVLEEGALNPNSWPRGDDLIDTLLAFARLGIEPDGELAERIDQLAAAVFPE